MTPQDVADKLIPAWDGYFTGEPLFNTNIAFGAATFRIKTNNNLTPTGEVFTGVSGNWTGASTATVADATGYFLCTSDRQDYATKSVDWYTQRQTWIYRDEWVVV